MNEEEMKTKECPQHMMMMVVMQIAAAKEGADEETIKGMGKYGFCSGSACAMWQTAIYFTDFDNKPGKWLADSMDEAERIKATEINSNESREFLCFGGYCGLKSK